MAELSIPFNRASHTGREIPNIQEAMDNHRLCADGKFTTECQRWIETHCHTPSALMTNSCSAALQMSAILSEVGPGDEVVMPSFTFTSTATAVVLRGATPVFVDVSEGTLNLDANKVAGAITSRTRAIFAVHYAGVGCEMDSLAEIATEHKVRLVEDAAQGLLSTYRGRPLGSIGDLGCLSFHETKNVTCGEGGALLINNPELQSRAEVLRDKGTNRKAFFRGEVDKYSWMDEGTAFAMSEVSAAFLAAQLQSAESFTTKRLAIWDVYFAAFADAEKAERLRRPVVPAHAQHNGHMFYLLLPTQHHRDRLIAHLATQGIQAVTHYVALHSAPAGVRFGRPHGALPVTDNASNTLVRLPLWPDLTASMTDQIVASVLSAVQSF